MPTLWRWLLWIVIVSAQKRYVKMKKEVDRQTDTDS